MNPLHIDGDNQAHEYEDLEKYTAVKPAQYEVVQHSTTTEPVGETTADYDTVKTETSRETTAGSAFNITACPAYAPTGSQSQPQEPTEASTYANVKN